MHLRTITALSLLLISPSFAQTKLQKADVTLTPPKNLKTKLPPGYTIPIVDISGETQRQVIVDREKGQYLGHPTTVLLEDNKTMLTVYPKGHGRGAIVYKRSNDAGLTWSEPAPADALIEPTCQAGLIRLAKLSAAGHARLLFTNPASTTSRTHMTIRLSEDDGRSWPRSLLLEAGSSGYSSPAELADGRIGVLFERARSREIAFRAISLEQLTLDEKTPAVDR